MSEEEFRRVETLLDRQDIEALEYIKSRCTVSGMSREGGVPINTPTAVILRTGLRLLAEEAGFTGYSREIPDSSI